MLGLIGESGASKSTLGLAALLLMLGACGLGAEDGFEGPYARLGPPEAPVKLFYEESGSGRPRGSASGS